MLSFVLCIFGLKEIRVIFDRLIVKYYKLYEWKVIKRQKYSAEDKTSKGEIEIKKEIPGRVDHFIVVRCSTKIFCN